MSETINKYIEQHDAFVELLTKYYTLHRLYLERQSPQRTMDLRKIYKQMRLTLKQMEEIAQQGMKERRVEWNKTHRLKEKEDE